MKPERVLTKQKRIAELAIGFTAKESVRMTQTERNCIVRNRMRETCTSGSVRGEDVYHPHLLGDQVSSLAQDFLSSATSTESAQIVKTGMERTGSKVAEGVMRMIRQNQDIRNMCCDQHDLFSRKTLSYRGL